MDVNFPFAFQGLNTILIFEHQDQHPREALGRKSTWVVACQTYIMFQNSRNLIFKNHFSNSYSQNPSHIYFIHYCARKCKFSSRIQCLLGLQKNKFGFLFQDCITYRHPLSCTQIYKLITISSFFSKVSCMFQTQLVFNKYDVINNVQVFLHVKV